MFRYLFALPVIVILLFSGFTNKVKLELYDLQCENLSNPIGIDNDVPRFSWKIRSDKNGTEQKAFQLMAASDPSMLVNDKADLWDSGKKPSSSNLLVSYHGKKLSSGSAVYWKIRVWDQAGNVSKWSQVARFSIGLLNKEEWHAAYIGFPTKEGFNESPQLKKSFMLDGSNQKVFLHVNSLGYHEVYLNGLKVGDGVLSPAVSQFNKRSQVITYDVSTLLKKGSNNLIIWLGSGWYTKGLPGIVGNCPLVKAQLERLSNKRREIILSTDSSWVGRKSSYTSHGTWRSHQFGGEILDGALTTTDLLTDDTGDRPWSPVSVIPVPDHIVSPQMVELNRITETIKPVEIRFLSKDTFLIDMGKSLTGWTEIHFPALQKSQVVVLEYSDHLDESGKFVNQKQTDRYIASGEGAEIFKNKFNYHGYRYIRISNLKQAPETGSIKAYLIHTGYDLASGFQCSDPDLNKIHDMILYTLRCLSLGGDLVDCPQIERLGYGGDGNASTETAQTMFNLNPLYANWLQAWGDCIRDDGGMPHTAPNPYPAGGGPFWCGFIITASWNTYQNYGDTLTLKKYYPAMQKWLGYVDKYTLNGLLRRWPDNDYRNWYLGDWATPKGIDQKAEASVDLVNNCFVAVCYDRMHKIAGTLGKANDALLYSLKKAQLQKKIHSAFFDPSKNSYATGTQIDLTYPILVGAVPTALTSAVTKSLVEEIMVNHEGHFATGLVGIPVFTEWAIKNQATDLMYAMLKKKGYPGYMYMIDNGATTTWEHWNGQRSRIHNCYNGIGSWFYQALGGIRRDENNPGYRKVIIQPQIPEGVNWAKTFKGTPNGTLVVNWVLIGKTMELELEIPVGIDAGIVIPAGIRKYLLAGKEYSLSGEHNFVVNVKSGKYKLTYTI